MKRYIALTIVLLLLLGSCGEPAPKDKQETAAENAAHGLRRRLCGRTDRAVPCGRRVCREGLLQSVHLFQFLTQR